MERKKLKLLLSKEEGKIGKIGVGVLFSVFTLKNLESYSLENHFFNMSGNPNPQHIHNIFIEIDQNESFDFNINQQKNQSCLYIIAIGQGDCSEVGNNCQGYWSDITGNAWSSSNNQAVCDGNNISKTCRIRTEDGKYGIGYVQYEWHNNDPNFDCNSIVGIFNGNAIDTHNQGWVKINTWQNVI